MGVKQNLKVMDYFFPAEEISKQSNIDSVMWLLVITLIQDNNEKEKWARNEKSKNVLEGKKNNWQTKG